MENSGFNKEKRLAAVWYTWLWISPLFTIPTLIFINSFTYRIFFDLVCPGGYGSNCDWDLVFLQQNLVALPGSALWHLILLIPATNKKSNFVRWHGLQALLLAGIRTVAAFLVIVGINSSFNELIPLALLILCALWYFGTKRGQNEASRGDCSLARWFGHTEIIAPVMSTATPDATAVLNPSTMALLEKIRYSPEMDERQHALSDLQTALPEDSRLIIPFFDRVGQSIILESNPLIKMMLGVIRSSSDHVQREKAIRSLTDWGLVEISFDGEPLVQGEVLAQPETRPIV